MITIKIYNKDYVSLTTLTEQDFTNLSYMRKQGEIGDCSFVVRLDKKKINDINLEHYNRIEILDGGEKKFFGVITKKTVGLDSASIRCRESIYVLKRRLLGASYIINGTVQDAITDLLTDVNTVDDTKITLGDISGAIGSVNMTFNRANAFEILRQICQASNNQFSLTNTGALTVKNQIGEDKSASVVFRYNIKQIANSNILRFNVDDDGDDIVTKCYGKSQTYNSTQTNSTLATKYGVLEKYRDYRVVNNQTVLDDFTNSEISDKVYSPDIALNPKVQDNFEIGDLVTIKIKNSVVDIDDSFQIQEKRVEYIGNQKRIQVRINNLPNDLASKLAERETRLDLLEKQV